jgi:hypothetical protein
VIAHATLGRKEIGEATVEEGATRPYLRSSQFPDNKRAMRAAEKTAAKSRGGSSGRKRPRSRRPESVNLNLRPSGYGWSRADYAVLRRNTFFCTSFQLLSGYTWNIKSPDLDPCIIVRPK